MLIWQLVGWRVVHLRFVVNLILVFRDAGWTQRHVVIHVEHVDLLFVLSTVGILLHLCCLGVRRAHLARKQIFAVLIHFKIARMTLLIQTQMI